MRVVVWTLAMFGLGPTAAWGQQVTVRSLQGLSSANVVVDYLDPVAQRAGLIADSLRAAVEARLAHADVPLGAVGGEASGTLFISVTMTDVPGGGGVFAYRYDLSLVGFVTVEGRRVAEPRWDCGGLATTVAGNLRRVYDSTAACADKLAEAWREAGRR